MFYTTPVLVFPCNTVIAQYKMYYEQNRYVTNIFINLSLGHISNNTGGVHGYGWSPRGGSSFRQGAGAASPGNPDLETAVAAVQRGVCEKEIDIRGFLPEG